MSKNTKSSKEEKKHVIGYNATIPFGLQEYELQFHIRKAIHEYMFHLRRGALQYLKPAYSALYEYYISTLRPVASTTEQAKFDKDFSETRRMINIDARTAALMLDVIEKNIMDARQRHNLGFMTDKIGGPRVGVERYALERTR